VRIYHQREHGFCRRTRVKAEAIKDGSGWTASSGSLSSTRIRATGRQKPTQRSGTDPDDRGRNRDAQAEGADNCQDEFGKQIWLGSYIR